MAYSITLLVNTCYPRQAAEDNKLPTHSLNEKGALIMDVVLGILTLAAGALALSAGHFNLGPLGFLGNLSQAWSISLISAGGGVILLELTIFAIKSCKKDTPAAPSTTKAGRPPQPLPTPVNEVPTGASETPPRTPDGSPLILDPQPNDLQPTPPPSPTPSDPPKSPLSFSFIPFDPQNPQATPNLPPPPTAELPQGGRNPLGSPVVLPPPLVTATDSSGGTVLLPHAPTHAALVSDGMSITLPPPPVPPTLEEVQHNLEDLNQSLRIFDEKWEAAKSKEIETSLQRTDQRIEIGNSLYYVREYFEDKSKQAYIEPKSDIFASSLAAAGTEVDSIDYFPLWFQDYLKALTQYMYDGDTQEGIKARLPTIFTELDAFEAKIDKAKRLALGDPAENARRKQEAEEAAEKARIAAQFEKQKDVCHAAQYHNFFNEPYDLTKLDLDKGQKVASGQFKRKVKSEHQLNLDNLPTAIQELGRLLGKVKENELLSHEDLQAIEKQGAIVREMAVAMYEVRGNFKKGDGNFAEFFA